MRILWMSNAPWTPVGYGVLTNTCLWRLKALGHEMTCLAFYGLQGAPLVADGIKIMPVGDHPYGNDVVVADAEYFQADIVITNMDVWVLNPAEMRKVRWYPWLPVDTDPLAPAVAQTLKDTARRPLAYSKFGEQKLREAGFDALYIPCAVNTDDYRPVDRGEARKALGCPPDVFLVGIVAANKGAPSRKAFDQQLRAFKLFHDQHPDSMIYLHTNLAGGIGENLNYLLALNGMPPDAVATVSPYRYGRGLLNAEYMRHAYSAMDVLMNASCAEGFGLTIIEAQSCGTPVIVTDFSSMPELVRAGWKVGFSDKRYYQESYQVTPSVPELVEALEQAYQKRGDQALREQARAGMLADYDADAVTKKWWKPALELIEKEIRVGVQTQQSQREARTAQRIALRKPVDPTPEAKTDPEVAHASA